MPNHVTHRLFVRQGDPEALRPFIRWDEDSVTFDFNTLIPMPKSLDIEAGRKGEDGYAALFGNWTNVSVFDEHRERLTFKSRADLIAHLQANSPDVLTLGQAYHDNLAAHGAKHSYEWSVKHWGTKWNSYSLHFPHDDLSEMVFDTAWSVPEPVFHDLAKRLPEHEIEIFSFDEGHGFCAETCIEQGEASIVVGEPLRAIERIVYDGE